MTKERSRVAATLRKRWPAPSRSSRSMWQEKSAGWRRLGGVPIIEGRFRSEDKGKVRGGGDFTQEVAGAEPVLQIDVAGKKCGLAAVGRGSHHRGEVRR